MCGFLSVLRVAMAVVPELGPCGHVDNVLRAAAARTLLASVLAPRTHRSPTLTAALALFQAGRAEGDRPARFVASSFKSSCYSLCICLFCSVCFK